MLTTGSTEISDSLKTIKLSILNSVDCMKSFGRASFGTTNICALGKNGDATCQVIHKSLEVTSFQ
jgi:hypothetical protein